MLTETSSQTPNERSDAIAWLVRRLDWEEVLARLVAAHQGFAVGAGCAPRVPPGPDCPRVSFERAFRPIAVGEATVRSGPPDAMSDWVPAR